MICQNIFRFKACRDIGHIFPTRRPEKYDLIDLLDRKGFVRMEYNPTTDAVCDLERFCKTEHCLAYTIGKATDQFSDWVRFSDGKLTFFFRSKEIKDERYIDYGIEKTDKDLSILVDEFDQYSKFSDKVKWHFGW